MNWSPCEASIITVPVNRSTLFARCHRALIGSALLQECVIA
jgi:hypothetical protein